MGLVKEYTCPTEVQFRSYNERNTGLFKRAIKEVFEIGRNELMVEETCSKSEQQEKRMKESPQYHDVINQAENEMLRANLTSFVEENIREGTGKKTTVAEVGDLVLVKASDFAKRGTYGVITEIHGEESATVHTKDGDIKRAIRQVMPFGRLLPH